MLHIKILKKPVLIQVSGRVHDLFEIQKKENARNAEETSQRKFKKRLIREVRKNPELYDPMCKNFTNMSARDKIWRNISVKLKTEVETCKNVWITLREEYQRYVRRLRKFFCTGNKEGKRRPLMLFEAELIFLWRFVVNKRQCSPLPYGDRKKLRMENDVDLSGSEDDDIIMIEDNPIIIDIRDDDEVRGSAALSKLASVDEMNRLAIAIMGYRELYDKKHQFYNDYKRKGLIWNAIANELNDKATKLMKLWFHMQTRYEWEIMNIPSNTTLTSQKEKSDLLCMLDFLYHHIKNDSDTVYKQSHYLKRAWHQPIEAFKKINVLISTLKEYPDFVHMIEVECFNETKSEQYILHWEIVANALSRYVGFGSKVFTPAQCETTWLILRSFYFELNLMRTHGYQLQDKWFFEGFVTGLYTHVERTRNSNEKAKRNTSNLVQVQVPSFVQNSTSSVQSTSNVILSTTRPQVRVSPVKIPVMKPINQTKYFNIPPAPVQTISSSSTNNTNTTLELYSITLPKDTVIFKEVASNQDPDQYNNAVRNDSNNTLNGRVTANTSLKESDISKRPTLLNYFKVSKPTTSVDSMDKDDTSVSASVSNAQTVIPITIINNDTNSKTNNERSEPQVMLSNAQTVIPITIINNDTNSNNNSEISEPQSELQTPMETHYNNANKKNSESTYNKRTTFNTIKKVSKISKKPMVLNYSKISKIFSSVASKSMSGTSISSSVNNAETVSPITTINDKSSNDNSNESSEMQLAFKDSNKTLPTTTIQEATQDEAISNVNTSDSLPKITGARSLLKDSQIMIQLVSTSAGKQLTVHGPPLMETYRLSMPTTVKFIREVMSIPQLHHTHSKSSEILVYWQYLSNKFSLPIEVCWGCWNFLSENVAHFPQIAPMKELMKPINIVSLKVWSESEVLFQRLDQNLSREGWLPYFNNVIKLMEIVGKKEIFYNYMIKRPNACNFPENSAVLDEWRAICKEIPEIAENALLEIYKVFHKVFSTYMTGLEHGIRNRWSSPWWEVLAKMTFLVEARYKKTQPFYYIVQNKINEEIKQFSSGAKAVKSNLGISLRNLLSEDGDLPEPIVINSPTPSLEGISTANNSNENENENENDKIDAYNVLSAIRRHPQIYKKCDKWDKINAWAQVAQELNSTEEACSTALKRAFKLYRIAKITDPSNRCRMTHKYFKDMDEIYRAVKLSKNKSLGKLNIKTPSELNQLVDKTKKEDAFYPERFIFDINMDNCKTSLVMKNWAYGVGNLSENTQQNLEQKLLNIFEKYRAGSS